MYYKYLAKQIHPDGNGDPDKMHQVFKPQREQRERTIKSLTRLLAIVEHFGEMKRITEEACKKTGTGLPF